MNLEFVVGQQAAFASGQVCTDGFPNSSNQGVTALGVKAGRRDRFADGYMNRTRFDLPVALFREDVVRSTDADWDYGLLRMDGKDEPSFFEILQHSIGTAGSFGKNDNRSSLLNSIGCFIDAFECLAAIVAIDGYVTNRSHSLAEDRDLE